MTTTHDDRPIPVGNHWQPSRTSHYASRESSTPGWDAVHKPASHNPARRLPCVPTTPKNSSAPPPRHTPTRRPPARRPPAPPLLSLCPLFSDSPVTTSVLHHHRSTVHPSSTNNTPVPGPDPARLPLWWLGGVRARHRPQSPCSSRVRCGRAIHSPVRTWIRLAESWRRPAATASVRGVPPRVRRPRRWRIYRLVAVRRLQWDVGADVRALPWGAVDG